MAGPKRFWRSGHIQVALATAVSIIILAIASRRLMSRPISDLYVAIPPFLMSLYEGFQRSPKASFLKKTWVWVAGIVLVTLVIIAASWS